MRKKKNDLKEFEKEEQRLFNDIPAITYKEALERSKSLWSLIPIEYDVNPVRINNLMYETFHNDPDWGKHIMRFKIPVGDMKAEDVQTYLDKVKEYITK